MRRDDVSEVWARPLADGTHAVLLVNRGDARANVVARWDEVLDAKGSRRGNVRDLWERADVGERDGYYDRTLAPHACALVKVAFT